LKSAGKLVQGSAHLSTVAILQPVVWVCIACTLQAKHAAELTKRTAQVEDRKAAAAAAAAATAAAQQAAMQEQARLRAAVQVSLEQRQHQHTFHGLRLPNLGLLKRILSS
jgi:hypothetical protein